MLLLKQRRNISNVQSQLKIFYSTKDPFANIKIKTFETIEDKEEREIDYLSPDYQPQKVPEKIKPKIDKKKLILEKFQNLNHEEIYKILFKQGNEEIEKNNFSLASEKFSECILLKPNEIEPYIQRSKAYLAKGEIELARKDLNFIIENSSKIDPTVYYNLAVISNENLKGIENYKKSIKILENLKEKTIFKNELLLKCYNNISSSLMKEKLLENALMFSNKAIKLSKEHNLKITKEFYNRARCHHLLNNLKEAIEDYSKFLKENEKNITAQSFLSQCYSQLNHHEKSIEILTSCIEIILKKEFHKDDRMSEKERRKHLNVLFNARGDEYFHLKNYEKSIEDYTEAYSFDRRDFKILEKKANCYYELRQFEKGIDELSLVVHASPTIDAYIIRAKCYKSINKIQHSINDLIMAKNFVSENSKSSFNILKQLSILYFEISNEELCLKNISELLKIELDLDSILLASSILMKNMEYEKTFEYLNLMNHQDITITKGIAYFQLEKFEKSGEEFERAISNDWSNKKLKKYLSMAYWKQGKKIQAIKEYISSF
eukprot:gene241-4487_t